MLPDAAGANNLRQMLDGAYGGRSGGPIENAQCPAVSLDDRIVLWYDRKQLSVAGGSEALQALPIGLPCPIAHEGDIGDPQLDRQSVRTVRRQHHFGGRLEHDQQQIGVPQGAAGPGKVFQTGLHVRHDEGTREGMFGFVDEVTDRDMGTACSTRASLLGAGAQHHGDVVRAGVAVLGHKLRRREAGGHVTLVP